MSTESPERSGRARSPVKTVLPADKRGEHRRWASLRDTIGAFVGVLLGLLPHVLHHIGLIAGAALITGAGGNALFFAIGLVFSLPMLRRLYRRFGSWRAPTIAVVVFGVLFSLSAFLVGPALADGGGSPTNRPSQGPNQNHSSHHQD